MPPNIESNTEFVCDPTWSSCMNWRATVSPRIKSIGWKRFDMCFEKGEFVVAGKKIYSADSLLVDKYTEQPVNYGLTRKCDSNCNMMVICFRCLYSEDGIYFADSPLSDSKLGSPHDDSPNYWADHSRPSSANASPRTSPQPESSCTLEDGNSLDVSRVPSTPVAPVKRKCKYAPVKCSLCGQYTYVLRELLKLCVEDVNYGCGDNSCDGAVDSDSSDSEAIYGRGHASSSKLYPAVRWHYRTGFTIWDGCVTLSKFLELWAPQHYPRLDVRGRCVLELGAGSGILGNAIAALGAKRVVMTDLPYILPITVIGIERTWPSIWGAPAQCEFKDLSAEDAQGCVEPFESDGPNVQAAALDWRDPRRSPAWRRWICPSGKYNNEPPTDMVVAADVIWLTELVQPLVDTLSSIKESLEAYNRIRGLDRGLDMVLAFERRSVSTQENFFSSMEKAGFHWESLSFPDERYGTNNSALQICRFW